MAVLASGFFRIIEGCPGSSNEERDTCGPRVKRPDVTDEKRQSAIVSANSLSQIVDQHGAEPVPSRLVTEAKDGLLRKYRTSIAGFSL